ncbi:MAG: ABC transporter [Brevundimonas sp.]|nr:ABC transporter [Brevundimonas sp.]
MPVILSAEAAECGLVSMTMIARYHGHDVDLNGLRQRFPVSIAGATLRSLTELADRMGFSTRTLRLELSAVPKLALPAIVHWDLNHFVVLVSARRGSMVIHDPVRGRLCMPVEEFSKHFTGVALELHPSASFEPIVARAPVSIRSLWSNARGVYRHAAFVIGLSLALQAATFAIPFQLQIVIDQVIANNDLDLLTVISLGFGAVVLLQVLTQAVRDWSLQLLGNQMMFQMVGNLVRHLIRLPATYFEKRHVGDILSRVGSTRQIQDALTSGILSALIDGAMSLVALIILFAYSAKLTLIVLASVIIVLLVGLAFYPATRSRTEEAIATSAREQSHLMETIRAATTIKLMGREAEREGSWRNLYSRQFNATVSLGRLQTSQLFLQNLATGLQVVLIVNIGATEVLTAGGLSIGMIIAFLAFRQTFTDRTVALISRALQFRALSIHIDRIGDIISAQPDSQQTAPTREVLGGLELRDVSFRYGMADSWIFQKVNLKISAGDYIAVVGPSGSGKSTFLKLILGLAAPTEGQILIDGQPADSALWQSWRANLGVVSQDDRLLSGTLADNIAFFDPDLNLNRVHMAAMAAQIHGEIVAMPMNYLTLVGDMGSSLSAGQKQRILLARALYRRPKILVLDEGTANLDRENEESIVHLVEQLSLTRIVVAHRSPLVEAAGRILTVGAGRIDELGTEDASTERFAPESARAAADQV